MNLLLIEKQSA